MLPAREPDPDDAEHTPDTQARRRVPHRAGNPHVCQCRAGDQDCGGERDADDIDGREPASCTLARGPHPVALYQCNRNQRDQAENDEDRNQQQRHTEE